MPDIDLLKKCYEDYKGNKSNFEKIEKYYYGETDALKNFKAMEGRSNLKVTANFLQKLVDEEASYSFGNNPTYIPKDNNQVIMDLIEYHFNNLGDDHTINIGIEEVKMGHVFELSYIKPTGEKTNEFKCKMISPLNGYMHLDKYGEPIYFLHVFKKEFNDTDVFIDVYDKDFVYHYNDSFEEQEKTSINQFGFVPVGMARIGTKMNGSKTIYSTIKSIQDAYNTNYSDITCEISDFRNAILVMFGVETEETTIVDGEEVKEKIAPVIKDNALLGFEDKNTQDAKWLIKNINDTFIKNTLDRHEDMIYALTAHINNNEKLQSNLSGIALRSRLTQLEQKCKNNEKAMGNLLRTRLKCLFRYFEITGKASYDVNNIKIQFTPNVPSDITSVADAISKIPHEVMSNKSKTALLPGITNVQAEQDQIALEKKQELDNMGDLDNINDGDINEIE